MPNEAVEAVGAHVAVFCWAAQLASTSVPVNVSAKAITDAKARTAVRVKARSIVTSSFFKLSKQQRSGAVQLRCHISEMNGLASPRGRAAEETGKKIRTDKKNYLLAMPRGYETVRIAQENLIIYRQ